MFREKLERNVVFYSVNDTSINGLDGWDDSISKITEINALVKDNNAIVYGGSSITNLQRIVISMKNHAISKLSTLKINDIVEFDGKEYQILEIDLRGILPGGYGCRVVGELRHV